MRKNKQEIPEVLEDYIKTKDEFKEQYERKKSTQAQARNRRQQIRELKEDRDYN
jgi:hypothetical protein